MSSWQPPSQWQPSPPQNPNNLYWPQPESHQQSFKKVSLVVEIKPDPRVTLVRWKRSDSLFCQPRQTSRFANFPAWLIFSILISILWCTSYLSKILLLLFPKIQLYCLPDHRISLVTDNLVRQNMLELEQQQVWAHGWLYSVHTVQFTLYTVHNVQCTMYNTNISQQEKQSCC